MTFDAGEARLQVPDEFSQARLVGGVHQHVQLRDAELAVLQSGAHVIHGGQHVMTAPYVTQVLLHAPTMQTRG